MTSKSDRSVFLQRYSATILMVLRKLPKIRKGPTFICSGTAASERKDECQNYSLETCHMLRRTWNFGVGWSRVDFESTRRRSFTIERPEDRAASGSSQLAIRPIFTP